jgi:hypothetical protein
MRYLDFRDAIQRELNRQPAGLTWKELRDKLRLPYERACPTWVKQLELEIGLTRARSHGPAKVWSLRAPTT